MKKRIFLTAAVAVVAGFGLMAYSARGQNGGAPASIAHKVGLIDMAHIFKEYAKFQTLREDLKADFTRNEDKAKAMVAAVNSLNAEMKELKQGSPEFAKKEKSLLQANTELESFRRNAQREMITKEAEVYKQIYLEVSDAVEKYAYHYKYTLILRFMRDDLEGAKDPQEVLARMNKQVVYFRAEDDITDSVLEYLNRQYGKPAPKATEGAGAATPRAGAAPRTAAGNK